MTTSPSLPLSGVNVLDLTRVLAGPFCTMMLGDLGADVIKVEAPGRGDDTRSWGPPFLAGESAYFLCVNRNKRSLVLDLKSEAGRQVVRELASRADVVVENFKVGQMAAWGLGYETLRQANPRLVYCAITGYGQTGPYAARPGYDFVVQAEGGVMSITGPQAGPPYKVGVAIVDVATGLFAATSILAGLFQALRTGRGAYLDVALLDCHLGCLVNVASNYLVTGETPGRYGNAHASIVPYQEFETTDGFIILAVGNDSQFVRLCETIGRPDLATDERFQSNAARVAHRELLIPLLQAIFRGQSSAAWLARLQAQGIPCGPVNTLPQILADPHVLARQMLVTVDHPTCGPLKLVGPPVKLLDVPVEAMVRRPPPLLGQHTQEILKGWGGEGVRG